MKIINHSYIRSCKNRYFLFIPALFSVLFAFRPFQVEASPEGQTVIECSHSFFSNKKFLPKTGLTDEQRQHLKKDEWRLYHLKDQRLQKTIRWLEVKPADPARKEQMQTIRQHLPHPPEGQDNLNKAQITTRYNTTPNKKIMSFVQVFEPEICWIGKYQDSNFRTNLDWPDRCEMNEPENQQLQAYYHFINQIYEELKSFGIILHQERKINDFIKKHSMGHEGIPLVTAVIHGPMSGVAPVFGLLHNDGTDWSDTLAQAFCSSQNPTKIAPLIVANEFVFPYTKTDLSNELTHLQMQRDKRKITLKEWNKSNAKCHSKYNRAKSLNEEQIKRLRRQQHFIRTAPYQWIILS